MIQPGLKVIFDSVYDDHPHRVAELDVVAVHGLNFKNTDEHARKTWTMGDKLWLNDFLPGALSRPIRVMMFEYNSSPAVGAAAIKLDDHAKNLLQWLNLRRKIVDKKSATWNLQGTREKQILMHADHSTICKFESANSLACELVLSTIKEEVERALKMDWTASSPVERSHIPSYPLSSITPVKTFVQRTTLRDSIRNQLVRPLGPNRQGEVKKIGVWGMGGAGKSQLALSYLQRFRTEYDATFWIQAEQPASIDRDFLAIYRLLADPTTLLCNPNPDDVKREVLSWFTRASGKFFIVFDGADYLHQKAKSFVALSEYIPGSPNIHIIITSRASIARSMSTFEGVSVGELEESQSVELFLNCAEIQPSRNDVVAEAKLIVHELGCLALAISMAGKYVSQTLRLSSNLSVYLDEFHRHRRKLLSETPDELVARYDHSVMTV
ncbi:proteinrelated to kinesin light chain, partial [Metarhizium majus ARSEF 297]